MRHEAERKQQNGNTEPDFPCLAPEVIIYKCTGKAGSKSENHPDELSFEKVIGIAMTILGERTRAEEHHHPEGDKSHYREQEEVDAASLHEKLLLRLLTLLPMFSSVMRGFSVSARSGFSWGP